MPLDKMKKNYPDMRILDETDKYFIGHIYEEAYLIEKRSGQEILHDFFYGDPTCGLISKNNDWAIIGGEHLILWKNGKTKNIEELKWIHALRTKDHKVIEILIDPWAPTSAIWTLDTGTLELKKIKDFDDYREKEYTDEIVW